MIKSIEPQLLPSYSTRLSAGADLLSATEITIPKGGIEAIPTGVYLTLPDDMEAQIRSRSGLASKGIIVANSPGTVDPDYKGIVKVLLLNLSNKAFVIRKYDRIAQLVFSKIIRTDLPVLHEERGTHGFGSTENRDRKARSES